MRRWFAKVVKSAVRLESWSRTRAAKRALYSSKKSAHTHAELWTHASLSSFVEYSYIFGHLDSSKYSKAPGNENFKALVRKTCWTPKPSSGLSCNETLQPSNYIHSSVAGARAEDDMLSAIFAQPDEGCSITECHAQETCPGKVCGCYESCCKDSKFRAHDEGHSKARKEHILCYFDANYCSTTAGCTVIPVIPETDALFDSYSSPSVVACLRGNHTRSE